ncbi:hypothetical protein L596_010094 [Steinernema carpocapsae]|uniref:Carboxylic ester hydrolase n=1 Tax=Steinernema carpocapsae TaxID=34508 RepID=A0A4U5PHC6_STECR|nr:hypothetical protein L596_010094 [Steinernema carpocapsae]
MFAVLLIGAVCLWRPAEQRAFQHQADDSDLLIRTKNGLLRGVRQVFNDRPIAAFLGVPYGKTPTGSRRFAKPELADRWTGEFTADTLAKTCYLTPDTMFPQFPSAEMWNPPNALDEDCLSLNMWVPQRHNGSVIVWIYGGGFFSGSPSLDLYDGRVLAAMHDTIVVAINYRLGPFGFLYFGLDSPAPGNMGLLDQQLAMRWVHNNIADFGGDPRRVTLLGESSGGASVTAHLFAPSSDKLFHNIIVNSAAIINSWATKPNDIMLEMSISLARKLNCSRNPNDVSKDVERVLKCMSEVPPHIIQREADQVSDLINVPMMFPFVPIEEDLNFFQGNVYEKIRTRNFKKDISAIVGTVQDEGTYWLPYYLENAKFGFHFNHTVSAEDVSNRALINRAQYTRSFDAFMPNFGNSLLARHALLHAYEEVSDRADLRERLRDGVARFVGDYSFTCSLIEFSDFLADNIQGGVYMYYFTKRSSANTWPKWMGAMHGYEIEYFFGMPFRLGHTYNPAQLPNEQKFSEIIMNYWMNFANSGSPTDIWPKYNRITRKSFVLGDELTGTSHRIDVDVHGKYCRLIEEAKRVTETPSKGCNQKLGSEISSMLTASSPQRPPALTVLLAGALLLLHFVL